jgi:hypothetical protein
MGGKFRYLQNVCLGRPVPKEPILLNLSFSLDVVKVYGLMDRLSFSDISMIRLSANWYINSATQALDYLNLHIDPPFNNFVAETGNLAGMDVVFIQIADFLKPDRLTPEVLIARSPCARPEAFIENLLACAGRGWLYQEAGKFWLTEAGTRVAKAICELCDRLFVGIEALPKTEMKRLLTLLNLVENTVKILPEPTVKPAFGLCLCFDRGRSVARLAQIRRRMLDLLAFWDDVQVSVWQPIEPEGQLWETLTLVWRGQAKHAAELATQLTCRCYSETDYAAALERLVARNWLVRWGDDNYLVHPKTAQMLQQVEETTEHIFETAFESLNTAEMNELQRLMAKFSQSLEPVEIPVG